MQKPFAKNKSTSDSSTSKNGKGPADATPELTKLQNAVKKGLNAINDYKKRLNSHHNSEETIGSKRLPSESMENVTLAQQEQYRSIVGQLDMYPGVLSSIVKDYLMQVMYGHISSHDIAGCATVAWSADQNAEFVKWLEQEKGPIQVLATISLNPVMQVDGPEKDGIHFVDLYSMSLSNAVRLVYYSALIEFYKILFEEEDVSSLSFINIQKELLEYSSDDADSRQLQPMFDEFHKIGQHIEYLANWIGANRKATKNSLLNLSSTFHVAQSIILFHGNNNWKVGENDRFLSAESTTALAKIDATLSRSSELLCEKSNKHAARNTRLKLLKYVESRQEGENYSIGGFAQIAYAVNKLTTFPVQNEISDFSVTKAENAMLHKVASNFIPSCDASLCHTAQVSEYLNEGAMTFAALTDAQKMLQRGIIDPKAQARVIAPIEAIKNALKYALSCQTEDYFDVALFHLSPFIQEIIPKKIITDVEVEQAERSLLLLEKLNGLRLFCVSLKRRDMNEYSVDLDLDIDDKPGLGNQIRSYSKVLLDVVKRYHWRTEAVKLENSKKVALSLVSLNENDNALSQMQGATPAQKVNRFMESLRFLTRNLSECFERVSSACVVTDDDKAPIHYVCTYELSEAMHDFHGLWVNRAKVIKDIQTSIKDIPDAAVKKQYKKELRAIILGVEDHSVTDDTRIYNEQLQPYKEFFEKKLKVIRQIYNDAHHDRENLENKILIGLEIGRGFAGLEQAVIELHNLHMLVIVPINNLFFLQKELCKVVCYGDFKPQSLDVVTAVSDMFTSGATAFVLPEQVPISYMGSLMSNPDVHKILDGTARRIGLAPMELSEIVKSGCKSAIRLDSNVSPMTDSLLTSSAGSPRADKSAFDNAEMATQVEKLLQETKDTLSCASTANKVLSSISPKRNAPKDVAPKRRSCSRSQSGEYDLVTAEKLSSQRADSLNAPGLPGQGSQIRSTAQDEDTSLTNRDRELRDAIKQAIGTIDDTRASSTRTGYLTAFRESKAPEGWTEVTGNQSDGPFGVRIRFPRK